MKTEVEYDVVLLGKFECSVFVIVFVLPSTTAL